MPKYKRQQTPKLYRNYRSYKRFLRLEFSFKCVYCDRAEPEIGGKDRTHIDHYRPKSKFSHLLNTYSNLFYSCPECNQAKGEYWPKFLQWFSRQIILNVCDHDVDLHIDKSAHKWAGLTLTGKWNIEFLKLSSKTQIQQREGHTLRNDR